MRIAYSKKESQEQENKECTECGHSLKRSDFQDLNLQAPWEASLCKSHYGYSYKQQNHYQTVPTAEKQEIHKPSH